MPKSDKRGYLAKKVGQRIRLIRNETDRTQEHLAIDVGVSKAFMSRIENGIDLPSLVLLDTIAKELGVEIADLVGFDTRKVRLRLLNATRRMTDSDVGKLVYNAGLEGTVKGS